MELPCPRQQVADEPPEARADSVVLAAPEVQAVVVPADVVAVAAGDGALAAPVGLAAHLKVGAETDRFGPTYQLRLLTPLIDLRMER